MTRHALCRWSLPVFLGLVLPVVVFAGSETTAKQILAKAPQRGICLLAGDIAPDLPLALADKSELIVYVQVPTEKQVAKLRRAIAKTGRLGSRIYVVRGDTSRLHLANDLADVVYINGQAPRKEVMRVLHPGATGFIGKQTVAKAFSPKTDDWRHPYHGPDNNPQSQDKVARGPFLTHFMAEPWYAAMPQMSVISGGRVFKVFGNRSSKQPSWDSLNTLLCMNAYNGTLLWKKKLKPGFLRHRNTFIATPDTLYFADDKSCQLIDPATGKVRDEIVIPKKLVDGPVWSWMALQDGVLYALVGKTEPKVEVAKWRKDFRGAGWPWWKYKDYAFGFGRTIVAVDPKAKRVLWHHREKDYLDMRAMCMHSGKIYFHSLEKFLGCLDAKSGKVLWKASDPKAMAAIGKLSPAQNPYFGFITTSYVKCSDKALYFAGPMCKNLVAVSAENGKFLWQHEGAGNSQVVVRPEAVYALGGGRRNEATSSLKVHPLSGKIMAKFPSRDRCTRATGCVDAIFTRGGRGGSTAVFNVTSNEPRMGLVSPMRPACQDGVTIAHGYLFWGPWMCRCDFTQIGAISLGPAGDFEFGTEARVKDRLEMDVAANYKVADFDISKSDWPTYRQNNASTTQSNQSIPTKVQRLWTQQPSSTKVATAPVTAGGLVFVGGADGSVRAVDANKGKVRWRAFTGGAIKYPAAVSQGRVYVGSGDGWVYCLEAATGKRLWRFQAAPTDRVIPIFGSLISTWPVGGGVLVEDGVVYAAAGNANFNGTHVYALDAKTGKIRWQNNDSGHKALDKTSGAGVQGHLLLHNKRIYMQGGNLTGIVSYNTADGKFQRRGKYAGRYGNISGKDLYVLAGQVHASGLPLYFRPQDSHFIERATVTTTSGIVAVFANQIGLADPKSDPRKPKSLWKKQPFHENNAVAVGQNAVVVAGVNRKGEGENVQTTSGVCALDLKTGKLLWQHALPAQPSGWGLAIDRQGRVIVTLQDGRVLCFGSNEG